MVLDAIEGDLLTKSDFALLQEQIKNQFKESEFRMVTRLGFL